MSSTAITPCQYLFAQSSEELFPAKDAQFINGSLVTMMKIVDNLVRKNPEALFLFDPTAFNNQCHLYSLFVAQAVNQMKTTSSREVPDGRFLYLSFFLSYAFLTDPKLLERLACRTLTVMGDPAPTKEFRLFLKDPGSIRMHASRRALNLLFAKHMQRVCASIETPLGRELAEVANADLQLPSCGGKGTLYTFPKMAGVVYLIDTIFRERIALLFKVKVLTKEGVGSFIYSKENLSELEPTTPVVVFEMVATGESLSYGECRDIAKRCPSHSQRNVSSKNRHDPTEACLFCSPQELDATPYRERFEPVLSERDEMLLALGADFVLQEQESFLPFFSNGEKFPRLTELFESSVPNIKRCFLSMAKPMNMSVSHVYTDCARFALKNKLVIDAAYERHLEERALI